LGFLTFPFLHILLSYSTGFPFLLICIIYINYMVWVFLSKGFPFPYYRGLGSILYPIVSFFQRLFNQVSYSLWPQVLGFQHRFPFLLYLYTGFQLSLSRTISSEIKF
jgi:hypothetical protein